jgi:methionine synthase II (cobalamin-independent)
MSIVVICKECDASIHISSDKLNDILARSHKAKNQYIESIEKEKTFSEKTTKHWMSQYNTLLVRHSKVMENKKKHIQKMKHACYAKINDYENYIDDLEKKVLYYRNLELMRKGELNDQN